MVIDHWSEKNLWMEPEVLFLLDQSGRSAMIRSGAPLPPFIFMGRAMTSKPIAGN